MIKFSKEKVLLLHRLIAEATGGSMGVRDEALLESALKACFRASAAWIFIPQKRKRAHGLATT